MFSEVAAIVKEVGPVALVIAVLAYFLLRLIDTNSNGDKSYSELLARHLELERKFTVCREALAKAEGETALVEQAQSYAIKEYLDDTKTYANDLETANMEIERLQVENSKQREEIRRLDEAVENLQGLYSQLRAKIVADATPLPNEMASSQDAMDSRKDSE